MIKEIAWNTFKKTGNIDTFLELKQVIDIEENMRTEGNEIIKNQGNNYSGKNSSRFW